jgi:hypothetical protein
MSSNGPAIAKSLAEAEKHLESLSVLSGILASGIERARRNLRQVRAEAASTPSQPEKGHAPAGEISPDMLGG